MLSGVALMCADLVGTTFRADHTVIGTRHHSDNTARISASFAALSGSGFALDSAPIGRDAALVGLGADIKVASWPATIFAGYGGAFNGSGNAQSFDAGVRFTW